MQIELCREVHVNFSLQLIEQKKIIAACCVHMRYVRNLQYTAPSSSGHSYALYIIYTEQKIFLLVLTQNFTVQDTNEVTEIRK